MAFSKSSAEAEPWQAQRSPQWRPRLGTYTRSGTAHYGGRNRVPGALPEHPPPTLALDVNHLINSFANRGFHICIGRLLMAAKYKICEAPEGLRSRVRVDGCQ